MSSALILPPTLWLVTRCSPGHKVAWWVVFAAFCLLTLGNGTRVVMSSEYLLVGELLMTTGYIGLLASALCLVVAQNRRDVGGLIDAAVVAMAGGQFLWTFVLRSQVAVLDLTVTRRALLVITVIVLSGALGALCRLWVTNPPMMVLRLMVFSVLLTLACNVVLAMTTGALAGPRPPVVEALFLLAYSCIGVAMTHRSIVGLSRFGRADTDRLSRTRLTFLGSAAALAPAVGAVRQLMGLSVDTLSMAMGTVAIIPLIMVRIGVLASQRERAEHALRYQATHDALTGLPNRAEILERLSRELERERTGRDGTQITVLFCDLDGFKEVNDTLGHEAGDALLQQIARRVAGELREGETLARYGGDEFLIVAEAAGEEAARAELCQRLDKCLAEPFDIGGERVTVGASVGVAVSDRATAAKDLIRRADYVMYTAKQRRREKATDVRAAVT